MIGLIKEGPKSHNLFKLHTWRSCDENVTQILVESVTHAHVTEFRRDIVFIAWLIVELATESQKCIAQSTIRQSFK